MRNIYLRASLGLATLCVLSSLSGCVSERASRNGVFNENQYVRKDFLVKAADAAPDAPGYLWYMKATVTDVSSPNPLGSFAFEIWPGVHNTGDLVRFQVTSNKLTMIDAREFSTKQTVGRIPVGINAWPVTNVDLKYRVNLDGETTNFFEENQERDWQHRQWIKLNFDKNDLSDLAGIGQYAVEGVNKCADLGSASATLVPDSLVMVPDTGYIQWKVNLTFPLKWDDPTCYAAYDTMALNALRFNRYNVSMNVLYSLTRAPEELPDREKDPTAYVPLEVPEKDPIRRKYGPITYAAFQRDDADVSKESTGSVGARELVMRFNPKRKDPVVWYFEKGFPDEYKQYWTGPGGVKEKTNDIFTAAGADLRIDFKDYTELPPDIVKARNADGEVVDVARPPENGDVRYQFLRWLGDRDMQASFAGVTQFFIDPRTGETKTSDVVFNDFAFKEHYVQLIRWFLAQTSSLTGQLEDRSEDLDTEWTDLDQACTEGTMRPFSTLGFRKNFAQHSTLFAKMATLLKPAHTPPDINGLAAPLEPWDFVPQKDPVKDKDFFAAYYKILPYSVFRDPATNLFVTPPGGVVSSTAEVWKRIAKEADFHAIANQLDHGTPPFEMREGAEAVRSNIDFVRKFHQSMLDHRHFEEMKPLLNRHIMKDDLPDPLSTVTILSRGGRMCVKNDKGEPRWESKAQWVKRMYDTYWKQVMWHEFGHVLGLEHNFMASVDRPHFPPTKKVTILDHEYNATQGKDVETEKTMDVPTFTASSIMEYNATADRVFWEGEWAPYDKGALYWIYANEKRGTLTDAEVTSGKPSISGQISSEKPWNDKLGYTADGKTEELFLFCSHEHLARTPLCRQGDIGTTPAEIIANELFRYEWGYRWRNFRTGRKIWDLTPYDAAAANSIWSIQRFAPLWAYDLGGSQLLNTLRRVGITNPNAKPSDKDYYDWLASVFQGELSAANKLAAAFQYSIIFQESGERPYATVFDKYYGDVLQQGIFLDKSYAVEGFLGFWPVDNYDRNVEGSYMAQFGWGWGDLEYNAIAEKFVNQVSGSDYAVYTWAQLFGVTSFAMTTFNPIWPNYGRVELRDLVGSYTFTRERDFLDFFRGQAIKYAEYGCASKDLNACAWDPRKHRSVAGDIQQSDAYNRFVGPDGRRWIWVYLQDRNIWVAADQDRNTSMYNSMYKYTLDVVTSEDDGHDGAYTYQKEVKYLLDLYSYLNTTGVK